MTITCTKCKLEQSENSFRWKNKLAGVRQSWCKSCFSIHERSHNANKDRRQRIVDSNRNRRHRNAKLVHEYLSAHPCIRCGENDPVVLDFDHRDEATKKGAVCDIANSSVSVKALMEEIAKCDVLCTKCHRRKTAKQFGWYKNITPP